MRRSQQNDAIAIPDRAYQLLHGGKAGQEAYNMLKRLPLSQRREAFTALSQKWYKRKAISHMRRTAREFSEVEGPAADDLIAMRNASRKYNFRYWLARRGPARPQPLPDTGRYLSYEPWPGGHNNIRMSLEMAAALAFALNRTLVWSPQRMMYLRGKGGLGQYFDIADLRAGVPIISYDKFAEKLGLQSGKPFNDIRQKSNVHVVDKEQWSGRIASGVVICVPRCPRLSDGSSSFIAFQKYRGTLHEVDTASSPYETAHVLHFGPVLLGNFYNFIWAPPRRAPQIKRFVRDHIHFRELAFERAERIIAALGGHFAFSCMHVRRNDFQFKEMWLSAEQITANSAKLFEPKEQLYIATDERSDSKSAGRPNFDPDLLRVNDHSWFAPLSAVYRTRFLGDFAGELSDTLHSLLGCIEQLVCSRSRVFVGTYKSTFTSYIHRLRGYMRDVDQKQFLYTHARYPEDYTDDKGGVGLARKGPTWSAIGGGQPFWGREFLEAWEETEVSMW